MTTLRVAVDAREAKKGARDYNQAVDGMRKRAKDFDRDSRGVDAALKATASAARNASTTILQLESVFNLAIRALGGFSRITQTIAKFEETVATLGAVARATAADLDRLRNAALQMGSTTRFSATEAAEGLLFLARAGFSATQAITALPAVLNLAQAGAVELGFAADVASNVLSQFNLTAEQTSRVVDDLIIVSNRANTDVRQLAEALKFAGPAAAGFGLSVEQTAAALGVLGDAGIQGSLAGTNFRGILAGLAKVGDDAAKALAGLGLSAEDINPALNNIEDVLRKLRDSGVTAAEALTIFGRRNVAAALQVINNVDKIQQLTEAQIIQKGEAEAVAKVMDDTLAGALKSAQSAVESFVLASGEAGLSKTLKDVATLFADVVRVLAGSEPVVEKNRQTVMLLVRVLKGVAVALAALLTFKIAAFFISATAAIIKFVSAMRAAQATLATTPWGALGVAISSLIGVVVSLTGSFDDNSEAASRNRAALNQTAIAVERIAEAQVRFNDAVRTEEISKQRKALQEQAVELDRLIVKFKAARDAGTTTQATAARFISPDAPRLNPQLFALPKNLASIDRRFRLQRREFGGQLRRGPVTRQNLIPGIPGRQTARSFIQQEDFIERLIKAREELRVRIQGLAREEAKEQRQTNEANRSRRAQESLLKLLAERRREAENNLRAESVVEAKRLNQRQRFVEQAKEIIKQRGLLLGDSIAFLAQVNKEITAEEKATKQLEMKREAQARLAEQTKLNEAAVNGTVESLQSQLTSLEDGNRALQLRLIDEKALTEEIQAQIAIEKLRGKVVGANAAVIENLRARIKVAADARRDLNKQIENRERVRRSNPNENPITRSANEAKSAFDRIEGFAEISERVSDNVARSFEDAFSRIIEGTSSVEDAFRNLGRAILFDIIRQSVTRPLTQAIGGALSAGLGALGGLGGGAAQGFGASSFGTTGGGFFGTSSFAPSAKGNLFKFALGGMFGGGGSIISAPTVFPMRNGMGLAGESGPEAAIAPLKRGPGGNLGVEIVGGGGQQGPQKVINQSFNMTITTPNPDAFRQSKRQTSDQFRRRGLR